jgi:hypothetical protein
MDSYKKVVSVVVVVVYLSLSLSLFLLSLLSHLLIGSHGRVFKMTHSNHNNKNVYRALCFSGPSESSGTNLHKALCNYRLRLSHLAIFCVPVSRLATNSYYRSIATATTKPDSHFPQLTDIRYLARPETI